MKQKCKVTKMMQWYTGYTGTLNTRIVYTIATHVMSLNQYDECPSDSQLIPQPLAFHIPPHMRCVRFRHHVTVYISAN
ncbi:hypothetical protein J6590_070716 [Homalodisca vitripennis]|nr:hypothetical protein J6590_070716 [Homalodisca vitripennis]